MMNQAHQRSRPRGHAERLLDVRGLHVTLAGQRRPVLHGLDLEVRPGEIVGIRGRTGAGKTALQHAITGLVPWLRPGAVNGRVLLDGGDVGDLDPSQRARAMGVALDRASAQLFLRTARRELEAAARFRPQGDAPSGRDVAETLGLSSLLDTPIHQLSSGQQQRVALATALSAAPRVVLLDEPLTHLDPAGVVALRAALDRARSLGGGVLVNDHAGWLMADVVDRWLSLEDGRLVDGEVPSAPELPVPRHEPGAEPVLEVRNLSLARGGTPVLEDASFTLHGSEIVVLSGPSGAGKSTLARALAGEREIRSGEIVNPRGRAALMLPNAELQLFATTVAGELKSAGAGRAEISRVLERHGLEAMAARPPWTLSRGERQRLVHAALDVSRPPVVVLDEPEQGLDAHDLARLAELVLRRAEKGRAYLIITQRRELRRLAHRHLRLEAGRLSVVAAGEGRDA